MNPRRLSVAVGAAITLTTLVLTGCLPDSADDPPDCLVSPDPTAAVCSWGRDYQNWVGQPIVYVRYLPHGGWWQQTQGYNCNDIDDTRGVCTIGVQSATGFAALVPGSANS